MNISQYVDVDLNKMSYSGSKGANKNILKSSQN